MSVIVTRAVSWLAYVNKARLTRKATYARFTGISHKLLSPTCSAMFSQAYCKATTHDAII